MIINRVNCETGEEIKFFQDGYIHKMVLGFKKAIEKHNTTAVIIIDGRSGMGKTTLANQLGISLDESYGLHKVFYNPDTFLAALKVSKKGDCLLFDEAMLISSRSALSAVNKMIVQAMSMIRSKKIYIIFCVNAIFDLDKNIAISRADLLLHVYGNSLVDRGKVCAFFKGSDGQDRIKTLYLLGKKLYSYGKPKANFYGKFGKEFVVDEKEYEKQKQEGVNAFLSGKVGTRTVKAFETRNNMICGMYKQGIKCKDIAKISKLSVITVRAVCKKRFEEKNVDLESV